MQMRAEISDLVSAINQDSLGSSIRMRDQELAQLEAILGEHPEIWPMGLIDALKWLQRKLRWESIDNPALPAPLWDFFDQKFRRDLDPMAFAMNIGRDLGASCGECECRC
jgi:hypothetical protein